MHFADVEPALTQDRHGRCERIVRSCVTAVCHATRCYRALIRLRLWSRCGLRCAVAQLAPANPANIRGQTRDAEREAGFLFQPFTNGFHALPFCEGGVNLWPQRADLARLRGRFFGAPRGEASACSGDPVPRNVGLL